MAGVIERLRGGLIVSISAPAGSPLAGPAHVAAIAVAAERGGAAALRVDGPDAVAAIRPAVSVPIIGLRRRAIPGSAVTITPEVHDAIAVCEAGADLVAFDATARPRAAGEGAASFLRRLRAAVGPGIALVADVDDIGAGQAAAEEGADLVATTLAGYTAPGSAPVPTEPDLEMLAGLASRSSVPVIAQGRYSTQQQVADAFAVGAFAVAVGTAITDPTELTRRFAAAAPGRAG
ncbi:N-acetylmannosamine-6-phosphate 2-epimerase [Capillimicrobium parvum]|uniref:N-acylglucosamine-6-phosphate 2-epimerase n=1 Tax=Capillimicrobium parvum TaxID=2884022 RepID=A0A9E6XYW7_9ACTN|nr:putative N-acetylmannosamine-6-phosphate 2-epimerase [Capillimicrobium parvum]UGS36306.1 Putative N-acetylmannosamine-6-phosphate 2-epimerase [Capillimicrobium parvum]